MKSVTEDQARFLVGLWDTTGPELDRIRRESLHGLPYHWEDVDALLEMGASYDGPERLTTGLVEMQRRFMELARRQGLAPPASRQAGPAAKGKPERTAIPEDHDDGKSGLFRQQCGVSISCDHREEG